MMSHADTATQVSPRESGFIIKSEPQQAHRYKVNIESNSFAYSFYKNNKIVLLMVCRQLY